MQNPSGLGLPGERSRGSNNQQLRRYQLNGRGTIKAVNSATSVTVIGEPRGGPPPEMMVFFEGVDSPRFKMNGITDSKGYALREKLRKFCIGKKCEFQTNMDLPGTSYDPNSPQRRFGDVILEEGNESLTKWVLKNGLATVRKPNIPIERLPEESQKRLNDNLELEKAAQEEGLNIHDPNFQVIEESLTELDINAFYNDNKGKEVPAYIETVISASFMRAYTVYNGKLYNFPFQLTNIQAPDTRRNNNLTDPDSSERVPQPFSEEAKYFVEKELLQRDLKLIVDSCSHIRLDCRVQAPKGDLSEVLLLNGYAHLVGVPSLDQMNQNETQIGLGYRAGGRPFQPTAISPLPANILEKYRKAQDIAQKGKKRIWMNYVPPSAPEQKKSTPKRDTPVLRSFYGVVTEVVSGDTINVAPINTEKKFKMGGVEYDWKTVLSELHMLPTADSNEEEAKEADDEVSNEVNQHSGNDKKGKGKKQTEQQKNAPKKKSGRDREIRRERAALFKDGTALVKLDQILLPEQHISLASIIAPRMNRPNGSSVRVNDKEDEKSNQSYFVAKSNPPQPPYAFEAREFLRNLLIGKVVAVNVEYRRASTLPVNNTNVYIPGLQDQANARRAVGEEREFASVMYNLENINVRMVKEGLARPVRHRENEPCSRYYSEILKAEEGAIKAKKRLFEFENEFIQDQIDFARKNDEESRQLRIRRKPRSQMTEEELKEEQDEFDARRKSERAQREAMRKVVDRKVYEKAPIIRLNDISREPSVNRQMQGQLLGNTSANSVYAVSAKLFTDPPYVPGTAPAKLRASKQPQKTLRFRREEEMLDGVVENVISPIRMKVLIPKHHLIIQFGLEGLESIYGARRNVPLSQPATELEARRVEEERRRELAKLAPEDRFAEDATREARLFLLGKNVKIGLNRLNQNGRCWMGAMSLEGADVASVFIAAGLAWIPLDQYRTLLLNAKQAAATASSSSDTTTSSSSSSSSSSSEEKEVIAEGSLLDIQKKAKARAIGIWKFYDENAKKEPEAMKKGRNNENEEESEEEEEEEDDLDDLDILPDDEYGIKALTLRECRRAIQSGLQCRVIDIVDSGAALFQIGEPPNEELTEVCNKISSLPKGDKRRLDMMCYGRDRESLPLENDNVAVQVFIDEQVIQPIKTYKELNSTRKKQWQRGKVDKIDDEKRTISLTIIDSMAQLEVPFSMVPETIMKMDEEITKVPQCSFYAFLAYVKPYTLPKERESILLNIQDIRQQASDYLKRITRDGELYCTRLWKDDKELPYVLLTKVEHKIEGGSRKGGKSSDESDGVAYTIINIEMVRQGYNVCDPEHTPNEFKYLLNLYREAEDNACRDKKGFWVNGDIRDDEEYDSQKKERDEWRKSMKEKMDQKRNELAQREKEEEEVGRTDLKAEVNLKAEHARYAEEERKKREAEEERKRKQREEKKKAKDQRRLERQKAEAGNSEKESAEESADPAAKEEKSAEQTVTEQKDTSKPAEEERSGAPQSLFTDNTQSEETKPDNQNNNNKKQNKKQNKKKK